MTTRATQSVQLHRLTEGAYLFHSPQGNVLFGCPPEILKRILAAHLPMPDTVVLPEKLRHYHSSQSSLEFPLYHFLFVQRGLERKRRFQVVGNTRQCKGLAELLRVTVVGPTDEEMIRAGTPEDIARELYRETQWMALKNPEAGGRPYRIEEMINFRALEPGHTVELYPAREREPAVGLERVGEATYRLLYGEEAFDLDMAVSAEQQPSYEVRHVPFDRAPGQFTVNVLGRSNGFDPNDPANGYVLNIDGQVVLWDCPAYLHQHLRAMELDPHDVDALVLSHVHEDHLDIAESLRDPPFELYATPEVYYSLLVKLAGVFGCTLEEAKGFHNWHPIDMSAASQEIAGATFEFFHSVHAIPAIGARISRNINGRRGLLHISGDHVANAVLDRMLETGGLSRRRYARLRNILTGEETLALIDVGGGPIHGDFREYLDLGGRIGFMHTGLIQEELPAGMELIQSGEVLSVLE